MLPSSVALNTVYSDNEDPPLSVPTSQACQTSEPNLGPATCSADGPPILK